MVYVATYEGLCQNITCRNMNSVQIMKDTYELSKYNYDTKVPKAISVN